MILEGNIITNEKSFYGTIECHGNKIAAITFLDEYREGKDLILAGFIETHFHGMGNFDAQMPDSLDGIRRYAITKGITTIAPTFSSMPEEDTLTWLRKIHEIMETGQDDGKCYIAGAHLEGPWLSYRFRGGMREDMLRLPTMEEAEKMLQAAPGNIRIVTIAPELPGSREMIQFLKKHDIAVSLGHSECPPEKFPEMVDAGISQVCHFFDAYDIPVWAGGVRQVALTDMILIDDRVMIELILDGLHVPEPLIHLVHKAAGAGRIIGITDSLQGAGLPEGRFLIDGRKYVIRDGDVGRLEENGAIVGASLTMNRAFLNLTKRFSFTKEEATTILSANPAKILNLGERKGRIAEGFDADLAILAPDHLTVKRTVIGGKCVYENRD
ncbi:MAG: amidohydrolase family protein [Lentisphaeria bacterium]|nr:amidohydrolase family protein [Lentisphaeria bacterium]